MGCEMGVLGVGHLATALLDGVFKRGVLSPEQVLLSDHVPAQLDRFAAMGCTIASSNVELKAAPRLLLAVRPQSFVDAASSIGDLSSEQLVISVMAGLDSSTIQQALGGACRIVRAMPNTGATFGASMTCLATGAGGNEEDLQWTTNLFNAIGATAKIDESLMSAATAVCGSGPGWIYLLASAMVAGARDVGFDEERSQAMVRQVLRGASLVMDNTSSDLDMLLDSIASAGGTTEAGLDVMRSKGFEEAVRAGIIAARDRGEELSG